MVVLLFITFFVKLPYRFWLFTHRFLGVAFLFSGLHIIFVNSDAYRDVPMKIYLILWLVIGIASYMYRTVLGNIFVKRSPYRVITVAENNSVIGMELEPMQKKIDFKPGQFVFIRFRWADEEGIISEAHPFSIASGESEGVIRLYVKALGDYTAGLKLLKPGTIAEIEGAFGRFVPANYGSAPQVWIAGGIGITPYLSMVRSLQEMPQQIYLIHSVKTQEEIAEKHVLQDLIPQNYPNFKFIPFVSDEMGKFIDAEFIDQQVGGLAGKEIFICGPPPMMKSLRAQLNQRGIPNRRIHSEEFAMT
jgi:predicted ferric reductase